jgi:hypothetical protein
VAGITILLSFFLLSFSGGAVLTNADAVSTNAPGHQQADEENRLRAYLPSAGGEVAELRDHRLGLGLGREVRGGAGDDLSLV